MGWRRQFFKNKEDKHWIEEVTGAENEAGALIVGFLVLQTSSLIVTGKQPSLHDDTCSPLLFPALCLWLIGLALFIALVVASCIFIQLKRSIDFNIRMSLAMSGAYCMERSSKWMLLA